MKRFLVIPLSVLLWPYSSLVAQETGYGIGYQTIMLSNPAFAGIEGEGKLRIAYFDFYPGRNYNFHSFYASYDSYIPSVHGGGAFFVSDDYIGGLANDTRGGCSYAYHFQAGRDLFFDAGLSASFFHRGFNRSEMVFPDQIDPLGGVTQQTSEQLDLKGKTVFDAGAGFLMIAGRYTAGIAVNHLTTPDLSGTGTSEQRMGREVVIHLSGEFTINSHQIRLKPVVYGDFKQGKRVGGIGAAVESATLSFNAIVLGNRAGDLDLQAGLFVKLSKVTFFYNYTFNISSANNLLPASLVHNAGIILSLKNVDKRKIIKTINFPKC